MTPIPKSYSKQPLVAGNDILFTATHPTIVGSVIGTTTNNAARSGSVGILRAGATDVDWVSRLIPVASGASADLIPAKLSMDIGDALVVNASGQSIGQRVDSFPPGNYGPFPDGVVLLLSNPDGSKIVAFCGGQGIWLSEDGQVTARKVYTSSAGQLIGAYFAGKFRAYTSQTSSLTSTDGITWETEVCVNAPTSNAVSVFGNMILKGTELYGATANRLKKSTDGLTFANHGAAVGLSNSGGFTWTGTNWVASNLTAGTNTLRVLYANETAASWVDSAGGTTAVGPSAKNITSIGATVFAIDSSSGGLLSQDHGVTFAPINVPGASGSVVVSAGDQIIVVNQTNGSGEIGLVGNGTFVIITTGDSGAFTLPTSNVCAINSTGLIAPGRRSVDATLSRRGGFTVTANVLEMQA